MQFERRDAAYRNGEVALLLVDMQKIWLEPGCDPDHPERTADHYFYRRIWDLVVPNQERLLGAARVAGVEVIHTVIRSLTPDGRDRSLDHKLSGLHVAPGAREGEVIDRLAPLAGEIVLPKTSSGVFNSTVLDYILRNLGVRQLIVAGVVTDQCVDMAVRDGADLGYVITCVEDGCAAPSDVRHQAALSAFSGYCWTTSTDIVVDRLQRLGAQQGK